MASTYSSDGEPEQDPTSTTSTKAASSKKVAKSRIQEMILALRVDELKNLLGEGVIHSVCFTSIFSLGPRSILN